MAPVGRSDSVLQGRVVFLVGARRSGTNWLHRILGVHPEVQAVPSETYLFSHGIAALEDLVQHGSLGSPSTGRIFMERNEFLDAARDFCDRLFLGLLEREAKPARYLVERTPWHVHQLPLIGEVYPDASVIHIIRDGRDVARSLLTQGWVESAPANMVEAAEEWRAAIVDGRAAAPALRRYREVRYEALFADPGAGARDLFEWLDLPVGDELVERVRGEAGARFNVDASMPSVEAGKWRKSLSPEQLAAFESVAGATLTSLGYGAEPDVPPAPKPARRVRPADITRRAVAALRPPRPPAPKPPPDEPLSLEWIQRLFDDAVGHIHTGRYDELEGLLSDDAHVVTVWDGEEYSGRGRDGFDHLVGRLAADQTHRGRQVRGDVHPGGAVCTGIYTHIGADGRSVDSVVIAHFGHARIRLLAYYRVPLAHDVPK